MSEDNVQVSVQWMNSTVFASEHIECLIKFTNVTNSRLRGSSPGLRHSSRPRDRWKDSHAQHARSSSTTSSHARSPSELLRPQDPRHIKAFGSNNEPASPITRIRHESQDHSRSQQRPNQKDHRRSISIVSIGNDGSDTRDTRSMQSKQRPYSSHTRASSMQILPRRNGFPSPGPRSASIHDTTVTPRSPGIAAPGLRSETTIKPSVGRRRASEKGMPNATIADGAPDSLGLFQFPSASSGPQKSGQFVDGVGVPQIATYQRNSPSKPASHFNTSEPPSSLTKVLSAAAMNETPRSSGEFFSMSNNSSETLASEYPTQETMRILPAVQHRRQGSSLGPLRVPRAETLMMGFAQVTGSFTLDGSLINQAPFEEVKRKAIIGGQGGGGLVRSQSVKKESSLLGSFGWGNIGETFGGLLADTGMSSIKESKKSVANKAIPVLSASQSVLFVDLEIRPGETKVFRFRHPIPKGSPPSYRGKAIKIQYNLVIGTQRAGRLGHQNQVKKIEIPFRVLPAINESGEIMGHDLMTPHTLLSSGASVSSGDVAVTEGKRAQQSLNRQNLSQSSEDFLSYVDKLLDNAVSSENSGLLSPTEDEAKGLSFPSDLASTMKDKIDLTILRGNHTAAKRSATRFEINRNGIKVAVIILPRSAYRIGESIPVVIDFQNADVASYFLRCTLETSEIVDPLIALRSKASIHRVTRKIYASQHEATVSAGRVFFNPLIPAHATPEFSTSGVSLQWNLRLEFVTDSAEVQDDYEDELNDLMEEIAKDERGKVHAAIQGLPCEVFEVAVPLRIFGASPLADHNVEVKPQT